jgi:hypothetical protein
LCRLWAQVLHHLDCHLVVNVEHDFWASVDYFPYEV